MGERKITNEDILNALATVYDKTKDGIPHVSPPVEKMAKDYTDKYPDKETAAKAMMNFQIAKCTTSGFVTGFGGLITMPVTIPANIGSVLYVQMRMIACIARMGGYDINSDQVQTFIYACLAGVSVNNIIKKFGITLGEKLATQGIKKIPGKVLTKINQRIGFRFITKFGEKGLINIGKMIPVVGAVVSGGFDLVETKIIAARAYKMFIENDFDTGDENVFDAEVLEDFKKDDTADTEKTIENPDETDTINFVANEDTTSDEDNNSDKSDEKESSKIGKIGSAFVEKAKSAPKNIKNASKSIKERLKINKNKEESFDKNENKKGNADDS